MNKYHIFVLIKCLTLDEVENIRAKGAQSVHVYGKEEENHLHFIAVHEKWANKLGRFYSITFTSVLLLFTSVKIAKNI